MAMSSNKHDREHDKFIETSGGDTAVRVVVDTLPTGGASEATLLDILAAVDGLEGFTDGIESSLTSLLAKDFATETTLSSLNTKVPSGLTVTSTRLLVDPSGVTSPISAASLPLPTGASTSALQTTGNTSLSTIAAGYYTDGDIDTTPSGVAIMAHQISTNTLRPMSTKQLGTQVTSADWGLIVNSVIHGLSSAGGGSFVDVKVTPSGALNVAATQDTSPWVVSGTVTANQGGTWNINNVSGTISLPTGAATSAKQDTGNASLASIDTKLTAPLQVQTIAGSAGSMQIKTLVYATKSVTTSATLMNKTGSNLANRIILTMQPTNGTIYVGSDSSVTTSTGTPVETGAFFPIYANSTCNIYAIASGTVDVRIMEGSDQ